jgi:hypothetical protein
MKDATQKSFLGSVPDAAAVTKAQTDAQAKVSVMCLVSARLQLPAGNVASPCLSEICSFFGVCLCLFFFDVLFFPSWQILYRRPLLTAEN